MPGFSQTLFVDFPTNLEKHVICSICLNVFDNPINSDCGHTFCRECIENRIKTKKSNTCPDCKKEFRRKRPKDKVNDLIIISNNVFTRNLTVHSMVSELLIKCKYESNGCQQIIEFGLLSAHIEKCEHKICENCEFTVGKDSKTHNCFELMKNDRNEWIEKFNEEINKLKTSLEERDKLILNFKNHFFSLHFELKSVVIGTHCVEQQTNRKDIILYHSYLNIQLTITSTFNIHYISIMKIMYCSHPSLPVLIIEVDLKSCLDIREKIKLIDRSNGWFNNNSFNLSERYIITELSSAEEIDVFIELLSLRLSECKLQNICESIDEKIAKQRVTSARSLQNNSPTIFNWRTRYLNKSLLDISY